MQDIASSIKFALASDPPALSSPSNPYLVRLRSFAPIKSITLLASHSTLNICPDTVPPHRLTWSLYFRGIAYHLSRLIFGYLISDLATYPLWRVAPNTFGSPPMQPRDFHACVRPSAHSMADRAGRGGVLDMVPHRNHGLVYGYVAAPVGLGLRRIRVGQPEEFPKVMHGPLLSTSFNEFWGRKYHQVCRP